MEVWRRVWRGAEALLAPAPEMTVQSPFEPRYDVSPGVRDPRAVCGVEHRTAVAVCGGNEVTPV